MSLYADYDKASQYYDNARKANGAHHYLGLIYSLTGKTKENLHVLDMGCGTGNHAKFLLDQGLHKATIFDANPGMIEKATEKLKTYIDDGKVEVGVNALPNLPYDNESFDVVMCNQVLHHLTNLNGDKYSTVSASMVEAFRVLKHNGILIINFSTPMQHTEGFWWLSLYPESKKAMVARMLEPEKLEAILGQAGFTNMGMIVDPMDLIWSREWYQKADGPLYPEWRQIDSTISSCSKTDLENSIALVKQLKESGKLEEFVRDGDAQRKNIGQYAIYYAKKV